MRQLGTEAPRQLMTPRSIQLPHGVETTGSREVSRRAFLQRAGAAGTVTLLVPFPSEAFATGDTVQENIAKARVSLKKLVLKHAAVKDDPWLLMHGIRALGKNFSVDGEPAIDLVLNRYLQTKTVNGRDYLYMPVSAEGHANAFLAEAILDSAVASEYDFRNGNRRYTVGDLVAASKALFTFEPSALTFNPDELAWSLLAFAYTTPPDKDEWTNAFGKSIRFADVVEYSMTTLEQANRQFEKYMQNNMLARGPDKIDGFACVGTHLIYGLGASIRSGYTERSLVTRLKTQHDILIWRLDSDVQYANSYYSLLKGQYPDDIVKIHLLSSKLKFLGHALEVINTARVHQQLTPTQARDERIDRAIVNLCDTVEEIEEMKIEEMALERSLHKLLIGDSCHSFRALSLMSTEASQMHGPSEEEKFKSQL